jgi:serine/threonine protein phosphatase 1
MKTFVVGDIHGRCAQLHTLLAMLPRDEASDTLVFLGDLIDRGPDVPGVVDHVFEVCSRDPERAICLRGNHEQMLLDFVDDQNLIWIEQSTGSHHTFAQYTQTPLAIRSDADFVSARELLSQSIPAEQINFFRTLPSFHEDDFALYVHAGLENGKHPRDTSAEALMWARDKNFFTSYSGKPCVFGHTPTAFLPLRGRVGRHGIYLFKSAIGIDTGYNHNSALSCISLPDLTLYQAFANGETATHHIKTWIPEGLKKMQRQVEIGTPNAIRT